MADKDRARILCVDDEAHVLGGLEMNLRREYEVVTATSGALGLALLKERGPFSVVMSDMRMPEMDGATFLARVRKEAPETVRMLLTGQTELGAAIAAVNEGQIFRFLCKPCPPPALRAAFSAAVEQHRLITAEKVLLEQTLRGCVRALSDVLGMVNPSVFGHAGRIRQHVVALAQRLQVPDSWQMEVAAMFSQLGHVALPPGVSERLYQGQALPHEQQDMVDRTPQVTIGIISHIPRLDGVRQIIEQQHPRFDGRPEDAGGRCLGARILKVAQDYELLEAQGLKVRPAIAMMSERPERYDPVVLEAFLEVLCRPGREVLREIRLMDLRQGMTLVAEVRNTAGTLLLPRGFEVTPGLLERVRNFAPNLQLMMVNVSVRAT